MSERTCSLSGCERKHYGKNLCRLHYYAARRADPSRPRCSVSGCDRADEARGLCKNHYYAARRADDSRPRCSSAGCPRAVEAKGLCVSHYYAQPQQVENLRRRQAAWRIANPEKARAMDRRARNKEAALIRRRELGRRRKEQLRNKVDYVAVLARDGMTCHICGGAIESRADLHFDHVVPLAKGGLHVEENVRPSHALCNLRKGVRSLL